MILNIEQKKGDPDHLDVRITVYASIDMDPSELLTMKHPVASMVHNGLIVAQGNFKEQSSLKDFLKSEMGISLDEELDDSLSQLIDKMNGLESALDPQKLKDRLENMGDFEEFIPTPAKIVPFHSEQEIISQQGDVFYLGTYKNVGSAVLGINALPILYQARYREQDLVRVRNEIESLISQIEHTEAPNAVLTLNSPGVDVEQKLLKEFIPNMLYHRNDPHELHNTEKQFRSFMNGYRFLEDVDAIVMIIGGDHELTPKQYKLLELYAKKIDAVKREDFGSAESYTKEILSLKSQL
jgi:hypothetical protein